MIRYLLALALALETTAAAQQRPLTPGEQSELVSIDVERDAGHALYVAAPILHFGGAAMLISSVMLAFTCGDEEPPPVCEARNGLAFTGITLAVVGALAIIPAIILDVDSGARRRGLYRQHLVLGLGPTPGGVSLALAGRF